MATTDLAKHSPRSRRLALVGLGLVVVGLVGLLVWSLQPPPQMGSDEEVFTTVDALFTAVTARDEIRLAECERRLQLYREAGKLAPKAADYLTGVIRQARSGKWESAAQRLYDFMKGQRREGSRQVSKHKKDKVRPVNQR